MGWATQGVPSPATCERCGKTAEVIILRQTVTTIMRLRGREPAEVVPVSTSRRLLCRACAVPAAFANSQGVREVLNGEASSAVVRIEQ